MQLSDIDLNQLVLLQQLMRDRSVSKTAESLGLSQPAVSNALAKLRRTFGDELLMRTRNGMVATPRAEQITAPLEYALGLIQNALNQDTCFDPATLKRTLTISMTDIGEIVFLPALINRLRSEAPQVQLRTVRTSAANLREDMESGQVDLAIGPLPSLQAGFFQRTLFEQRYVCLFRQQHPLNNGKKKMTMGDFKKAEHLLIVSANTGHGAIDEALRKTGIERKIALTIPHFVSVGEILMHTDMVATVTETLAKSLVTPFGLAYHPHPAPLPSVSINVFWHAKVHRSPVHQWLRGMVFEMFSNRATSTNPIPQPPSGT